MKQNSIILRIFLAFLILASFAKGAQEFDYHWKFDDSYHDGKRTLVPDERANSDLILFGNAGLSVPGEGVSGESGDAALLFDGQERSQAHFYHDEEISGLHLHLWARGERLPDGKQHLYLASLTKVMRLTLNREGDLVFAVWDENRQPSVVKVPFAADGSWQEVEASYRDGRQSLRVGEQKESETVPDADQLFRNERGMFFFGANINNDNWLGAIDEVRLSLFPAKNTKTPWH